MKDEYVINNDGNLRNLLNSLENQKLNIVDTHGEYRILSDGTSIMPKRNKTHTNLTVFGDRDRLERVEKILNKIEIQKKNDKRI